ncbi:MAG: hypothetical protein ACFB9N_13630 [Geitlerinemataceae cyanobacterium]
MTDRAPQLPRIVKSDRDFPALDLARSDDGAIVECFDGDADEVGCCKSDGETRDADPRTTKRQAEVEPRTIGLDIGHWSFRAAFKY